MKNDRYAERNGRELVPQEAPVPDLRMVAPPPDMDFIQKQNYVSLATYWHILLKRIWTVTTTAVVLVTLVAIGSFRMTPIYRAISRVQVEADNSPIQSLNELYEKQTTDDAFLQTQIQLLKSESLAWRTIEQLQLAGNASFVQQKSLDSATPEERKVKLIARFNNRLSVSLVPKTRMLVVGFESSDPKLAARASTALVNNYIDYNFRLKYDATRQASGWMEQQLDELKAKVEQSQQALVDYERQHAMADINARDKQNVEEQMLSDLSRELAVAQGDRIQKESLYHQVRTNRDKIAFLAHNEMLQKLEERSADLQGQYLEALAQYGPKFPKAIRLHDLLEHTQTQIEDERNRVIERIRNDYSTALNREKLAAEAVARQKAQLGDLNQLLVQHNLLQREFEGNQQLYQNLLQRLKDATVSAGLRSTNIHLVDAALPPDSPIRPRIVLNILIGLLAGLVLGIVFAFIQEALDNSIKSAEELETVLGLASLGIIPLQRDSSHSAYGIRHYIGPSAQNRGLALLSTEKPTSTFAEAYRSLRTAVLLSLPDQPPRILLLTSSVAGEGKTTSSINLATVLAQRKAPVVILDCDLRKSGVSRALRLDNTAGLSTLLAGNHTLDQVLRPVDKVSGLWSIPSGPPPPSPADLLSSDTMADLLKQLSQRFEHVVIDTPPVLAVTDATILSRMADGLILVAECGRTSRAALQRTRRTLDSTGARILGVIMNKFDQRQKGYYYGYYYYGYQGSDSAHGAMNGSDARLV